MTGALIKGTVLGGLVLFVWGAISWMALPFHGNVLQGFANEDAVLQAITAHAPRSGVYLLPNTEGGGEAAQQAAQERMQKGPGVLAAIRVGPMGSMASYMLSGLLIQMAAALVGTGLLLRARLETYGARVVFLAVTGLLIGIAGHLPQWNWWHFSTGYTLLEMADLVISWTLAGLVIGKVAR